MNRMKKGEEFNFQSFLRQRETGFCPAATGDQFSQHVYSNMLPDATWDNTDGNIHGGVFNLDFSPDGNVFVAACEKKTILVFDPMTKRLTHEILNAHQGCVNCIRFLDSRAFASCSDDNTVALWDIRMLNSCIKTLRGHSNWVKNIEYSAKDRLLVTSGFDGSINTWDINSSSENGKTNKRVFHTAGLMRTRLNPDATKMIMSTTGGYLMIIHDLDLNSLDRDLAGFKPNLYRLMQLSNKAIVPRVESFTALFSRSRKRNRVEFIVDFPEKNAAEVVSSLQVHPQGWCVLSRNISNNESSEWSCVHDIQETAASDEEEDDADKKLYENAEGSGSGQRSADYASLTPNLHVVAVELLDAYLETHVSSLSQQSPSASDNSANPDLRIHKNRPRLTHFAKEPNVGRGFIKEPCFSTDGRIIASPYGYGIRLLSFNPECSELPYCVPDSPIQLHNLGLKSIHKDFVVSSKFAPNQCSLVTGCLGGKIVWYKPLIS